MTKTKKPSKPKKTNRAKKPVARKHHTGMTRPQIRKASALIALLKTELVKARIAPDIEPDFQPDWFQLCFGPIHELDRFLQIVTKVEPEADSLYERILCSDEQAKSWRYQILPVNAEHHEQRVHLEYLTYVLIPTSDVPELLKRLREHTSLWEAAVPPEQSDSDL